MSQWMKRSAAITLSIALFGVPWLISGAGAQCRNTVVADVVALDQPFFYNRLGAFNANGMMFALRRDVVQKGTLLPESAGGLLAPGLVQLRPDKRPRPIVLRVNAGDCLQINFTNLLSPVPIVVNVPGVGEVDDQPVERFASVHVNGMQVVGGIASDGSNVGNNASSLAAPGQSLTYTFFAEDENTYFLYSMGSTIGSEGDGGTLAFGLFGGVNVEPAGAEWYRSQVTREEMDLATTGATADGHPIFNYDALYPNQEPFISEGKTGLPILKMTQGNRQVHSDINAIITGPGRGNFLPGTHYPTTPVNPNQERPFREFTIIFHDEAFGVQAFSGFFNDPVLGHTLHGVRDGLGINYGIGGIGAEIIANRLGVGPMWDCNDCKYEEFFLTSWVVGDPGMVVDIPANAGLEVLPPGGNPGANVGPKATKALFPEDPAGIHHSYIGDHVKLRNIHAGPKEHHMFHLHSHQWVFSPKNDNSNYLDGQGIGPGSAYTYDIAFGGSGNRNKTPGDAIFHCHFYPHFAQGMWELWRNHDVFEQGTRLEIQFDPNAPNGGRNAFAIGSAKPAPGARALPDGEIVAGTPIPGLVPIPGQPMAPMPGDVSVAAVPGQPGSQVVITEPDLNGDGLPDRNVGYPLFIAAIAGHRPSTPPLDLIDDGGLPRHVIAGPLGANANPGATEHVETRLDFSKLLHSALGQEVPGDGTPAEKAAMASHAIRFHNTFLPDGTPAVGTAGFRANGQPPVRGAPYAEPCVDDNGDLIVPGGNPFFTGQTGATPKGVQFGANNPRVYKGASIQLDAILNKLGWHHPQQRITALWEDVAPTITGARPPEPFVMRLNTLDCAEYHHTNLVPSIYELDDYQVRTPTDIIGQHIHLVKFDVTSADGSGNGFNYEDGTLSPDEVRERIAAINAGGGLVPFGGGPGQPLTAEAHPFFGASLPNGQNVLGARTTVQRWFADPVLNNQGQDRTLGVVFTHDHFGPSSHQQVGLYATLLVEPAGSQWRHNETGVALGTRDDGGPTSWQAAIIGGANPLESNYREFFFEWSDFQHAYKAEWNGQIDANSFRLAINPSVKAEDPLATAADPGNAVAIAELCPGGVPRPCPEAISAADPGTMVVNYRNEHLGLRIFDPATMDPVSGRGGQAAGVAGDLAFAFSSNPTIVRAIPQFNALMPASVRDSLVTPNPFGGLSTGFTIGDPLASPQLTADVGASDPATPIMRVYQGDKVRVKLQVGATEESHNVTIHGLKWLQEYANVNSGWRNTQHMGIDEQFQFRTPVIADKGQVGDVADYLYSVNASQQGYWEGVWGFLRTYGTQRPDLFPLPDSVAPGGIFIENLAEFQNQRNFRGVCPQNAPRRVFDISAVRAADVLPTIVPSAVDPVVSPQGRSLVYNSRNDVIPDILGGHPPAPTLLLEGGQGPLHDPTALMYVLSADLDPRTGKLRAGVPIEPLILRARAGECIEVTLRNRLPAEVPDLPGWHTVLPTVDKALAGREDLIFNLNDVRASSHVGLHAQLLEYDITTSDGANVGRNPVQTAPPGGVVRYRWYAGDIRLARTTGNRFRLAATPVEFGALGLMPADRIEQANKGLVGAMVILPRGAEFVLDQGTRAAATVRTRGRARRRAPRGAYRDFVAVLQTGVQYRWGDSNFPIPNMGGEGRVGEDAEDSGMAAVNYRSEPAWFRLGFPPHLDFNAHARQFFTRDLFSNQQPRPGIGGPIGDPQTPVFTARAGRPVRMHFVQPSGTNRNAVLTVHGHVWQREPYDGNPVIQGPTQIADNSTSQRIGHQEGIGPSGHWDFVLRNGAGGAGAVPGDYLFRALDSFHTQMGEWGILRVQ